MSLYQCEKCGCIENTAIGFFHCRNTDWFSEYQKGTKKGMKLCSVCGPIKTSDGNVTKYGKWHGRFRRRFFPKGTLYTDQEGNIRKIANNNYPDKEDEIYMEEK